MAISQNSVVSYGSSHVSGLEFVENLKLRKSLWWLARRSEKLAGRLVQGRLARSSCSRLVSGRSGNSRPCEEITSAALGVPNG